MAGNGTNGSKWIRPTKRLAIYCRDGHGCLYCGAGIEDGATLTLDHLVARELGGTNDDGNLVTACLSCNAAKRALTLREWLAFLRDHGTDTAGLAAKVRKHTARKLDRFMIEARQLEADRA